MKIYTQYDLQCQRKQITLTNSSPYTLPMQKLMRKTHSQLNLSARLQSQQPKTTPSTLKILSLTWNLYGDVPPQQQLNKLFQSQLFKSQPDIIFIGTQQCQISLFWSFFYQSKPNWQTALKKYLFKYQLFATQTLQGLHSAILVLNTHKDQTFLIKKSVLKAGFCCNLFGNKGATQIKIKIYGQYLQFINCHLAPHQDNVKHRNQTLIRILNKMVCYRPGTQIILLGDMNYRLQIKNDQYKKFLLNKTTNNQQKVHYQQMLNIQQLRNQQQLKDNFFPHFQQGQIHFPPSYKMNVENDEYARSRVPGWTDRIFCRKGKLRRVNYDCLYHIYGSDHRPVVACYEVDIEEGISLFEDQAFKTGNCEVM